jgi:DNA mismatch repair ATPase MutS
MGKELSRLKRRKKVKSKIDELFDHSSSCLVIHYSCESFYDRTDGKTPRITSIGVRNLSSGQTESFSIHKVAEQKNQLSTIDKHYDDLEKEMLHEYFDFVKTHQNYYWIHWNMRDINYGFLAIEHRFKVLNGEPVTIAEDRKFDLARAIINLYGVSYIGHPRLEKLIEKNDITNTDFLAGKDEAIAFEKKEYIKLHQSTLRKVDIIANIYGRVADETLKTNSTWFQIHGVHPAVLAELMKEHWIWSIIVFIAIISGLLSKFI